MSKILRGINKVAAAGEAVVAEGEQEEAVEVAAGNNFLEKYFLKKGSKVNIFSLEIYSERWKSFLGKYF